MKPWAYDTILEAYKAYKNNQDITAKSGIVVNLTAKGLDLKLQKIKSLA